MPLIKRLVKGSPLTFAEGDANLDYLEGLSNGSLSTSSFHSYTGSVNSQFAGTSSYATTASYVINGGGSATLTQQLVSNQKVGGNTAGDTYNAGTSLEDVLRAILIEYIPPTIGALSLKNGGTTVLNTNAVVEVSSSYTFNTASFTAAVDNPNGRFAYSASFTASGATTGDFNYYFGNNVLGLNNNLGVGGTQTIDRTASGSVTFTLNTVNPETLTIISQTRTATYVHPIYYGMSTSDLSATTTLQGVSGITTLIEAKGTKTVTFNGTNSFFYIAYPSPYGNLATIVDLSANFDYIDSVTKYTVSMNNSPKWFNIEYYIYKLNNKTTISNKSFRFTFAT